MLSYDSTAVARLALVGWQIGTTKAPYVERFNKTVIHECLAPAHPTTIAEAQAVVDAYLPFYCTERPHQGDVCRNQPPAQVFPRLPALPGVPAWAGTDVTVQIRSWRRLRRW